MGKAAPGRRWLPLKGASPSAGRRLAPRRLYPLKNLRPSQERIFVSGEIS